MKLTRDQMEKLLTELNVGFFENDDLEKLIASEKVQTLIAEKVKENYTKFVSDVMGAPVLYFDESLITKVDNILEKLNSYKKCKDCLKLRYGLNPNFPITSTYKEIEEKYSLSYEGIRRIIIRGLHLTHISSQSKSIRYYTLSPEKRIAYDAKIAQQEQEKIRKQQEFQKLTGLNLDVDTPIKNILELPDVILNRLIKHGINTIGKLSACSIENLKHITRGFDANAFAKLIEELNRIGLFLKNDNELSIIKLKMLKQRMEDNPNKPLSEYPIEALELSTRSYNVLKRRGIRNIEDLINLTKEDLYQFNNIGAKSSNEIIEVLNILGLKLKNRNSDNTNISPTDRLREKNDRVEMLYNSVTIKLNELNATRYAFNRYVDYVIQQLSSLKTDEKDTSLDETIQAIRKLKQ